jgi:hypothetical protein
MVSVNPRKPKRNSKMACGVLNFHMTDPQRYAASTPRYARWGLTGKSEFIEAASRRIERRSMPFARRSLLRPSKKKRVAGYHTNEAPPPEYK